MAVIFRTMNGHALRNDEMTVETVALAVVGNGVVSGYRLPDETKKAFYVNASHVVEWWEHP